MQRAFRAALAAALFCCGGAARSDSVEVLTNNYDNARSGANLHERILNATNVTPKTFGRMFSYAVDGPVFAQPLIAVAVSVAQGEARDLVFIATGSNSVYAFAAGGADGNAALLWQRTLTRLPQGTAAIPSGILSTPVIDRATNTLYVVASLQHESQPHFVLHALDLRDGSDKSAGPIAINGAVQVDDVSVAFAPTPTRIAVQRAALALAANKVIIAFGGDYFEGWVFAYDKTDLRKAPAAFCTTCASRVAALSKVDYLDQRCIALGPGGGIWQAGRGPVVDERGFVYFFTGNKQHVIKDGCIIPYARNACAVCGTEGGCECKGNRSANVCRGPDACNANAAKDQRAFDTNEALIALDAHNGLALKSWFRPANWDAAGVNGLEINDLDLGGSGPLLLPDTQHLVGGGKQGVVYLLDTRRAADCVASPTQTCIAARPVQSFQVAPTPPRPNEYFRHILGGPVLWARGRNAGDARLFLWRQNDYLRSYVLDATFAGCSATEAAPDTTHRCEAMALGEEFIDSKHPGGILTISANGADPASAIVWAATNASNSGPGKLTAYGAQPPESAPRVLVKLWDSETCTEDQVPLGSDFTPPTVANGKVYLPTGVNRVDVLGLIESKTCTPVPPQPNMGPMLQ